MVAMLPVEGVQEVMGANERRDGGMGWKAAPPDGVLEYQAGQIVPGFDIGIHAIGTPGAATYVSQLIRAGLNGVLSTLCEIMADRAGG